MPRISNIELLERKEQSAMTIRTLTTVDQLPRLIGESYAKLAAYLEGNGAYLADVPYVAYYNMDMQSLDVEMGFPVAAALPGRGDIRPGLIPGGKVIFCIYRGPYPDMGPVYDEMLKWLEDNGLAMAGPFYEQYYNGADFPESELLTKIVMAVE